MTTALAMSPEGIRIMRSRYGWDTEPVRVGFHASAQRQAFEEAANLAVTGSTEKAGERWPAIQYAEIVCRGRRFGVLLSTPAVYGERGTAGVLAPALDVTTDAAAWYQTFGSLERLYLDCRRFVDIFDTLHWEHFVILGYQVRE